MSNVTPISGIDPREVLKKAREEIQKEQVDKAVKLLKDKYRERERAQVVLANIDREIQDLELRIAQGNI